MSAINIDDFSYSDLTGVNVTDSKGKVTRVPYNEAVESGAYTPSHDVFVYDAGNGKYTPDVTKAAINPTITLDKKTKNISIDAPKSFFDTQTYKEKVKPVLETISQNYKLNSDYKYALMNGDEDTKTSEDWVKEIEKELPTWVEDTLANEKVKKSIEEKTGLKLSDEQLITMSSVAVERQGEDGNVVEVKDDTIQALPESIKKLAAFNNLQGWDNGKVTYKNLMDVWDREKTSDADILQVYDTVKEYFDKGEFDDADEYAGMTAFAEFIDAKHPNTGFWRGVGDYVTDTAVAVLQGIEEFDAGALSIAEGVTNWAAENMPVTSRVGLMARALRGSRELGFEALGADEGENFVRDYLVPELDSTVKGFQEDSIRLNPGAGSVGVIVETIAPLAMQIATGAALGKAAASGAKSVAESMLSKTNAAKGLAAAEGITAEEAASAALNGTNFLLNAMSANKANTTIATAINTLKAAQTATAAVSSMADLSAQIIVDVAVQDSKLSRQLIDGNVSNETKEYVLEQIALDAGGWGIALGSMKALRAAGKTDVGRVANAATVPRINWVASRVGEYADRIKTAVHKGDANWNKTRADKLMGDLAARSPEGWRRNRLENRIGAAQRRQQNLTARRIERDARTKVGNLGGPFKGASSWTEVVSNAKQLKRESDELFTAAHATADRVFKRDVMARTTRIKQEFTPLNKAVDDYTTQLTKVARLEDKLGLKRAGKVIRVGVDENGNARTISQISKESNEYVNGVYRAQLGKDAKVVFEKNGDSTYNVQKEIDYYTEKTQAFRKKYPELAAELDKLLERGKQFSAADEDARVYEEVLDQATLDGRRGSEYFKNGYLRTQRVSAWDAYQRRGGEIQINRIRDDEHLKWGFEGDAPEEFQDITFVLFDDLTQVAKQSIRKEETDYLRALGQKVEVEISGEDVQRVKNVNPKKAKVLKTVQNTTNHAVQDMDDNVFNKVFEYKESKSAIMTAEQHAVDSGARVSRAQVSVPKVTRADRVAFVENLDEGNLDDLILLDQTSPFAQAIETEDDFQEFLRSLDSTTRKYLKGLLDGGAGEIYPEIISKEEKLAQLPRFNQKSWTQATGKKVPKWAEKYTTRNGGQAIEDLTQIDELRLAIKEIKEAPVESNYTLEKLQKLVANDEELLTKLKRQYVLNNRKIMQKPELTEVITRVKQEEAIFDADTLYAQNIRELEKIRDKVNLPGMAVNLNRQMDEIIDGFIDTNRKVEDVTATFKELGDTDAIVEYATLKSLTKPSNMRKTKDRLRAASRKRYNEILTANNKVEKDGKMVDNLTGNQIVRMSNEWADQTVMWYEERVNQRYGQATTKLRATDDDLVDYDDLFGKIEALSDDITGVSKDPGVVKTYDDMGREEYVRLAPEVADLITTMPTPLRRGFYGTIEAAFVKTFRMGTTGGLVPQSLIRQWFRDTGSAVTGGNVTRTMDEVEQQLIKVYGPTITDYYQQHMPDVWETLIAKSEKTGESVKSLAVKEEMERARVYIPDELQSNLYRFNEQARMARNPDGTYDEQVFGNFQSKLEDFMMKTERLNNIRETNRRVWVYNNAYLDALNNGHTVQAARRYAEMIQAEATTNFSRQTYHLANLSHTVPYLGAAINGHKSFWRLMAMDPVGMTTRIVAGYVVPLIALTNISVNDPENREVYKQIPEYEKRDHLVFVLNGQKISIPVPQEISRLIQPIQSWIETMHDANDHSAEELMLNNLVGFCPYDLQGFVNIDTDRILSDNLTEDLASGDWNALVTDHLIPGVSVLASQMMGPLLKSGVMWATGYDPYTRKPINTAYTTTDPETGESTVIDYKSGQLAKLLGDIFQGNFKVSAQMAQAVFNNLLGSGNTNIIEGLTDLALSVPKGDVGAGATSAVERVATAAGNAVVIPNYGEESNAAWRRAVRTLYREKADLVNNAEYQADIKALSDKDLTEDAKKIILARVNSKKEAFQERVLKATQNLVKNYDGGTLDRYKFASVIALMAFSNGYSPDPTNPLSKQYSDEDYQLAKAAAIETMSKMGFNSPNDNSIFGYYRQDSKTGEIGVELYSPLAILDFEKSTQLGDDVASANIKAIVRDNDLWTAHDSIKTQVDKIRNSKKKLTKQDYATIDAIYINWNAQVAKALAPYVTEMTPEAAINNTAVLNYLYPLIEVPNSWETNNKGYNVSLGDRGVKKKAYFDSWVKSMFSINDKYRGQY